MDVLRQFCRWLERVDEHGRIWRIAFSDALEDADVRNQKRLFATLAVVESQIRVTQRRRDWIGKRWPRSFARSRNRDIWPFRRLFCAAFLEERENQRRALHFVVDAEKRARYRDSADWRSSAISGPFVGSFVPPSSRKERISGAPCT